MAVVTPPYFEPRFAHSPSDALQCLLDLRTCMKTMRRQFMAGELSDRELRIGPFGMKPLFEGLREPDVWADWERVVSDVEPFYWSSATGQLVTAASASYPLEDERPATLDAMREAWAQGGVAIPPAYLPRRRSALCVFAGPCLQQTLNGHQFPLSALIWENGIMPDGTLALVLRGVLWMPDGKALTSFWSYGNVATNHFNPEVRATNIAFTKWACTAAMFLDQEVVVSHQAALERGVRRRCVKSDIEPPTCHIVQLRKELAEEHRAAGSSEHSSVEWSHRWLVRGHWRKQFFPKRGGHAPIYIHPHVKGPEDKPFAEPKPTVFAVVR